METHLEKRKEDEGQEESQQQKIAFGTEDLSSIVWGLGSRCGLKKIPYSSQCSQHPQHPEGGRGSCTDPPAWRHTCK